MKNLKTAILLQEFLDAEIAWRIREINHAKDAVRTAAEQARQAILRASIPLLYAHWEGYVISASTAFLNFVVNQRHLFSELQPCFIAHGMKKHLECLASSGKHSQRAEAVRFVVEELGQRANFAYADTVSSISNLSSSVFAEIAAAIGIAAAPYEPRYHFIDHTLLKRRNRIAHGEWLDVGPADFKAIAADVLDLIRAFKTDIENATTAKTFLR